MGCWSEWHCVKTGRLWIMFKSSHRQMFAGIACVSCLMPVCQPCRHFLKKMIAKQMVSSVPSLVLSRGKNGSADAVVRKRARYVTGHRCGPRESGLHRGIPFLQGKMVFRRSVSSSGTMKGRTPPFDACVTSCETSTLFELHGIIRFRLFRYCFLCGFPEIHGCLLTTLRCDTI